jgi:predicted nucleic acid-binding protein
MTSDWLPPRRSQIVSPQLKGDGGPGALPARDLRPARVAVSAITLTEVLRGGPHDAPVHRVLSRIAVQPVSADVGRRAGELLGTTGLSGHRCAIDAVVAATALGVARPVVLLTSDPDDLNKLVEEPDRPKDEPIAVVHV